MSKSFAPEHRRSFADQEVGFEPGGGEDARWFSCSRDLVFRNVMCAPMLSSSRSAKPIYLLVANEIHHAETPARSGANERHAGTAGGTGRVRSMREALERSDFPTTQAPMNLIAAAYDMLERRGGVLMKISPCVALNKLWR
ncbi:MAG: hypothetical protein R3F37_22565 [Candidatus Competibacteraceae bacterium]